MATLNENALTTLETIAEEISGYTTGGSDDSRIARYVNVASDLFERVTDRRFYKATNHTETVKGFGSRRLVVSDHRPVETINSVTFDDGVTQTTIDADEYELEDADLGYIRHIGGNWDSTNATRTEISTRNLPHTEQKLWVVDYDGGYVTPKQVDDGTFSPRTLPADIENAVIDYVVMKNAQQGVDPTVGKISLDSASISYVTVDGGRVAVPLTFSMAIKNYTDVVMG